MINILQTEFFRLKKSKLFWTMLGICAGLPLVTALLYIVLVGFVGALANGEVDVNVWDLIRAAGITESAVSGTAGLMTTTSLLAVITTSIFLSRDFSNGTFRNMLLANKSRLELYLSHLIMAIVIGASYMGANFVTTLLFHGSIFGFGSLNAVEAITGCITALAMGLVSVAFVQTMMCMFMFGTRRLAVALACPIAICMFLPSFILVFVDIYDVLNIITTGTLATTDLSWIPLFNTDLFNIANLDGALVGKILLYNLPLTVFFGFMGWVSFRKADLK